MRLPSSKSQVVSSVHLRPSLIWWCARCLTRPPQEFADSASAVALLQRQQPAAPSTPQHQASSARKAPTRAIDDQATDHVRIRTRSRSTSQTHFYPATGPGAPALALRPRSASLLRPPGCRQCTECCRVVCCEKHGGRGQQRRGLADRGSQQQQQQQQQPARTRLARAYSGCQCPVPGSCAKRQRGDVHSAPPVRSAALAEVGRRGHGAVRGHFPPLAYLASANRLSAAYVPETSSSARRRDAAVSTCLASERSL